MTESSRTLLEGTVSDSAVLRRLPLLHLLRQRVQDSCHWLQRAAVQRNSIMTIRVKRYEENYTIKEDIARYRVDSVASV